MGLFREVVCAAAAAAAAVDLLGVRDVMVASMRLTFEGSCGLNRPRPFDPPSLSTSAVPVRRQLSTIVARSLTASWNFSTDMWAAALCPAVGHLVAGRHANGHLYNANGHLITGDVIHGILRIEA